MVLPASKHRLRLALLALAAVIVGVLAGAPPAMADIFTPESGGSPNADDIDSLYKIVLYVAIVIFLIVEGALIWTLVKHRERRGGPDPVQIHGNTPLELGWTIGAALILLVITVITFAYVGDIKNPPPSLPGGLASNVEVATIDQPDPPADRRFLEIDVNGQQYLWRFDHPADAYDYHTLVVPTKTTVILNIESSDVQHSWWIPELGGKMDAVPGHTNKTWFRIDEPGEFRGQCAELCGTNHADMYALVRAVSPDEYQAYIREQRQGIKDSAEQLAEERRARTAEPQ